MSHKILTIALWICSKIAPSNGTTLILGYSSFVCKFGHMFGYMIKENQEKGGLGVGKFHFNYVSLY